MATKTITVTEDAYEALRMLKEPRESFTETILRISGKRSLKEFAGALSGKSAERLERSIKEIRRRNAETHRKRIKSIVKEFGGR